MCSSLMALVHEAGPCEMPPEELTPVVPDTSVLERGAGALGFRDTLRSASRGGPHSARSVTIDNR